MINAKWTRRFPGYGHSENLKVLSFALCNEVCLAFEKFESFLKVGYDPDTEEGLDMAFYRGEDLVFWL